MTEPNKERLLLFFDDEDLLFADGFDASIIGLDTNSMRVVYSKQKMIDGLVDGGMELDEAMEFLEFNTWCAYVGEKTPIYVDEIDCFE
jgi:hypothetical protein